MHFLDSVLKGQTSTLLQGEEKHFSWQWMADGVICLTPHHPYDKAMILSAGIHGNETAPIELLEQIYQDLFAGRLDLNVRLLLILGNPTAMQTGKRYVEYDMNRLFCGAYHQIGSCAESERARKLEQCVADFFEQSQASAKRYHYDLHTAIRTSLLPTFALLPYQLHDYDPSLLSSLSAASLDAVVYHNAAGKTFTHFSSAYFQAASATLELGQAKAFGQNDLTQFVAIDQVLRAEIANQELPLRTKSALRQFKVMESILKLDDDFKLNLPASAPNFSVFHYGDIIASQKSKNYVAEVHEVRVLFPNINVAKGLRAGLILEELN